MLNFPISYICLKIGMPPEVTFVIAILISLICFVLRLLFLRKLIRFPIRSYCRRVIMNILIVSIATIILPMTIYLILPNDNLLKFIIVALSCLFSGGVAIYYIGCTKSEKIFMRSKAVSLSYRLFRQA